MRVCILCEESKVSLVREKMKRSNILLVPCSPNGVLPATHRFCCVATNESGANELIANSEITTMEISGPKEFLEKWNLKIIR